jgi:hypothetical protein
VSDVSGFVGIYVGVFDDDLAGRLGKPPKRRVPKLGDRFTQNCFTIHVEIDVTGSGDAHFLDALYLQSFENFFGNQPGGFLEDLGKSQAHGSGAV